MNTARKMNYEDKHKRPAKARLYVIKDNSSNEDKILVNGKLISKYELNEKLAYFYEHGGPAMDI